MASDVHTTFFDFTARGVGLDSKDINGKSDPYIVIKTPTRAKAMNIRKHSHLKDFAAGQVPDQIENQVQNEVGNLVCTLAKVHGQIFSNVVQAGVQFAMSAAAALYHYARETHQPTPGYDEVFVSEVVNANLDPEWHPFRIGCYELCKGNSSVELLIECYDWDRFKPSDFIGSCKVSVQTMLDAEGEMKFQLTNEKNIASGFLCLQCMPAILDIVCCDFKARAVNLDKKNLLKASDPYFVIKTPSEIMEQTFSFDAGTVTIPSYKPKYGLQKHPATEGYREVYESSVIRKTLDPDWGMFQIGFYVMCRGCPRVKLLIECYDYNGVLPNKLIGSAEVVVQTLIDATDELSIQLLSKKKKKAGTFCVQCFPSNPASRMKTPCRNAQGTLKKKFTYIH
jgi:hypothetical protein